MGVIVIINMGVGIDECHSVTIRGKGDYPSPSIVPAVKSPTLVSDSGIELAPKIFKISWCTIIWVMGNIFYITGPWANGTVGN